MEKAGALAGPSRFVVKFWFRGAATGSRSPLHGRFPLYYEQVGEEIDALMVAKKTADLKRALDEDF
ncbi:MAG: hypothetical protein Kow0069_34880 [Promethearchaeota archaeon]